MLVKPLVRRLSRVSWELEPDCHDQQIQSKRSFDCQNADKPRAVEVARKLLTYGFELMATKGTAAAIQAAGLSVTPVNKVTEGRPHVVDMIKNNEVALVINTVEERRNAIADSRQIRTSSLMARVTTFTTIAGAEAAVEGMNHLDDLDVYSLQSLHLQLPTHPIH